MSLPESAESMTLLDNGDFFIITSLAIRRLTPNKKLTILATNQDWIYLHPNSIASDEKFIYVGIQSYIAGYPLTGKIGPAVFLSP